MISHCIIHVSAREALNLYIKNGMYNNLLPRSNILELIFKAENDELFNI